MTPPMLDPELAKPIAELFRVVNQVEIVTTTVRKSAPLPKPKTTP